jgi:hypothetical protein
MGKRKASIVTAILFCLLFISCASYQKYPSEWAELILTQDERCSDISGTYMNSGEGADKQGTYFSVLSGVEVAPLAVSQVKIIQNYNDELEISVWYKQILLYGKVFSKRYQEYNCSSKGVEIPAMDRARAAVARTTLYLARSKDGSLVVERKSNDGDDFLLNVPMVGNSYEWYRFKPVESVKPIGTLQSHCEPLSRCPEGPGLAQLL